MLSLIVAYARNRVIGKDGALPWRIPGELRRFRQLTTGNAVIMGRRSYEEVGSPLPDRLNIVLSSSNVYSGENLVCARNLEEAIALAGKREVFIAGGGTVYAQAIDLCDALYITEIDTEVEGDVFFPAFDESLFRRSEEAWVNGALPYRYVTLRRR